MPPPPNPRDIERDAIRAATIATTDGCRSGERTAIEDLWIVEQLGNLTLAVINLAETNETGA